LTAPTSTLTLRPTATTPTTSTVCRCVGLCVWQLGCGIAISCGSLRRALLLPSPQTCTKYTLDQCKSNYAGDMCIQGGTLLIVLGVILLLMTGFIRYNEYQYELSRKNEEAVRFLEDGSLLDDRYDNIFMSS